MSAHTPGPWHASPLTKSWGVYDQTGTPVAKVGNAFKIELERRAADARLIAAAPDMLVCLQHVLRWHDQLSTDDINRVRAVVAQALEKQAEVTRHD